MGAEAARQAAQVRRRFCACAAVSDANVQQRENITNINACSILPMQGGGAATPKGFASKHNNAYAAKVRCRKPCVAAIKAGQAQPEVGRVACRVCSRRHLSLLHHHGCRSMRGARRCTAVN